MKYPAFCGIAILVVLSTACSVSPSQYVEKGNKLFESGKYADAEINYQKAIQKDPNLGEAYYRLGLTELRQAQPDTAYKTLSRAADLLPKREDVAVSLADAAFGAYLRNARAANYYDQVLATSARLLRENPRSYDGLRLKGFVAMLDRHYPEAVELLKNADAAKPMQEDTVHALVECLILDDRGPEAEKDGLALIQAKKNFGPVYDTLYRYYMAQNRPADAEAILKTKVANNPDEVRFRLDLASHYANTRNEAALATTIQEIKDNKQFTDSSMDIGNFYVAINRMDDALRQFQAGVKENPKRKLDYQTRVAQVLIAQGKPDQALILIAEILKGRPSDFDARSMRAGINIDSGDPEKMKSGLVELTALATEKPADAPTRYNLGRARLMDGDANGALAEFKEAIKVDPRYLQARMLAANTSLQVQDYKGAGEYADQIIQLTGGNPMARLIKVQSLAGMGDFAQANAEASRLDREFPAALEPKLELASLRLSEKKFAEAETMFRALYTADSKNMRALQGLVEVFFAENRPDAAVQFLTAESAKTGSPQIRAMLADAALQARKLDVAIQEYTQLASANPKSSFDHMRLGDALLQKGETAQAIAQLETAKSLAPKDAMVTSMLALSFHNAGRAQEAQQAYREAMALDSGNPLVKNNLAYLMAETGGNLDEALQLAQDASRRQPANAALSDTVGWIYLKKNLPDSAVQILSNVVQKNPSAPVYHYHLGAALLQKGDRAGARRELQAALLDKPNKVDAEKIGQLMAKTL